MGIIQQITTELVEKILEKACGEQLSDLDALAADIYEDCVESARMLLSEVIRARNEQLRRDKGFRKSHGLVLKERDRSRQLLTRLGVIEWKRDYYYDKARKEYVYPLDSMLSVRKYERIGDEISAQLLTNSAHVSYARSSEIATGGAVSRQTVRNHLLKADVPEKVPEKEGKAVAELHICADEDHVHLQRPKKAKGKRNLINPLVTVTEGTEAIGARRNRTICPMHFVDENQSPQEVWKSVEGYIEKAYDLECLEKIYIHGDGGNWIKGGLEAFPQVEHVIDGYHFNKALSKATKACANCNVKADILNAIRNNDGRKADRILREMAEEGEGTQEFRTYLSENRKAIRNLVTMELPGSCTEGQVSHVLSERFSRNPMGWSREGLGKLSKLRVYILNGGELTGEDMKPERRHERYSEYTDWFLKKQTEGAKDWSIFDGEPWLFDTASATQIMLHHLGNLKTAL